MDKVKIGSKEFFIAKPVFIILDLLKSETGIDFALGMSEDKMKGAFSDMKVLARVMSLITWHKEDEGYDEKLAKEREEYFYLNSEVHDFTNCIVFFSRSLRKKEVDLQKPQKEEKPRKAKMRLVKPE